MEGTKTGLSNPVPTNLFYYEDMKKRDKLVFTGYAPGREKLNYYDEDFDIWGMNDLWNFSPPTQRWDGWFDIHDLSVQKNNARTGEKHIEWLSHQKDFPILTLKEVDWVPASVAFPLQEIKDFFAEQLQLDNTELAAYLTSTPSYMMALAIMLGYTEVHVFGINLLGKDEYEYQRPCFEYWVGIARGRGIKVVFPPESTIARANFTYGYDTHGGGKTSTPLTLHLRDRANKLQEQVNQQTLQLNRNNGYLEAISYAADMARHDAMGGYIPPPENARPEPAHDQQKLDKNLHLYSQFKEMLGRVQFEAEDDDLIALRNICCQILDIPDNRS